MAVERNPNELLIEQAEVASEDALPVSNFLPPSLGGTSIPVEEEEDNIINFMPTEDGGVEVEFSDIQEEMVISGPMGSHYENLAEHLSDEDLTEIGQNVYDSYESDKESREEWEQIFERGFDLLGLKLEETTEPFDGACTAVHPLLIESVVKFQSKASQELFPPGGPVKAQIIGASRCQSTLKNLKDSCSTSLSWVLLLRKFTMTNSWRDLSLNWFPWTTSMSLTMPRTSEQRIGILI